jgi:L-ascorbate metabolism protein UlaG (beta-lactamase superfamily)
MELIRSNFDGKRFHNPVPRHHGFGSLLRWMLSREPGEWREWTDIPPGPPPPQTSLDLRVTFVNHSTFLLQLDGVNILTDPIWSERASPLRWTGPKRHIAPGISFEDLPPIHVVLLSHDHYDHMDIPTLKRIAREHRPTIYTGLGNARRLQKHGLGDVVELDWWGEATTRTGARITAIPAQHFSGRTPFDRDSTLWCGFVVESRAATICFAGDSGIAPHFQQIGRRFPAIDVAILPIGAFRPEWFMSEVHMSPPQAVEAHLQLGAQISIASHFGTFRLADDGQNEPLERLQEALDRTDLHGTRFWVLTPGEGRDVVVQVATMESDDAAD